MRLFLRIAGFAILLAMLLAPVAAPAKVVVTETTKYYKVKGKNGLEVSRAMLSGGARNINMRDAIAATSTRFDISDAKIAVKGQKCVVERVNVKLDIIYLYPQWSNKPSASAMTQKNWNAFYAELLKHERMHGTIAKNAAKRIDKELLKLSGTLANGCRDFGRFTEQRFGLIAKALKRDQLSFDAKENQKSSKITKLQVLLLKSK